MGKRDFLIKVNKPSRCRKPQMAWTFRGKRLKVPITPQIFFCLNKSLHLFETHCAFLN